MTYIPYTAWALQERDSKGADSNTKEGNLLVHGGEAVRRLTPTECERLQGFPDGWTEGESDGARYRMLGNAVCVPVAEWIGRRIVWVESTRRSAVAAFDSNSNGG